jgi:hypothetical protein
MIATLNARLVAVGDKLQVLNRMVNDTMAYNWPNVTMDNVRIHVRAALAAAEGKDGA